MTIEKVLSLLAEEEFDGILLRKRNNFSWVTGGRHNHIVQTTPDGVADLVVMPDKVYVVTVNMEAARIMEEELADVPFDFELVTDEWFNGHDHLLLKIGEGKRMATDAPFHDWMDVSPKLSWLRSQLTEDEMNRYRQVCQQAADAIEETCRQLQPGQTEHEIASVLAQKVMAQGMNVHVLLVATDERIYKYRHPIPTGKRMKRQAMLVLCAERGGLVANVTRLVHFGPLPKQLEECKQKLAYIDACMNASTRPGIKVGDIINTAIREYKQAGYPDDWKKLHLGGPTGYATREYLATSSSSDTVRVNQAFAWNPALPGVKSEDTILVTENGIEILTETGKWPYIEVECNGMILRRPDMMVRD
ncbi:Xaa-Pro aminopeptidase [Caldalkalibacillus uzonensis]|uniref:Xaa-Pro aminopeptidase n=1 Tax=Caldalkalibacillus uzonensis TaxID=353224 RepID=A0ABU0CS09_9BACI|nr:M24 family metallopeptidase [Caldalkalibacillus uzonensis]MDQ0338644.1 Xaa-Pro aminopeptidase [Caldalkalibacillus uzonensis]